MDIDFSKLPRARLEDMFEAAAIVLETMRVEAGANSNISKDILRFTDNYMEWEHIPPDDVYDQQSHSQYYFHTHAKGNEHNGLHDDEHGHFHTFIRGKGFPDGIKPVTTEDFNPDNVKDISEINSHLIAIATNNYGQPMRLFTTNRWVVADTWVAAEDNIKLLDFYNVDHAYPSWPVNLWITNMIRLYRPQIEELIRQRDVKIEDWKKQHPDKNVFEDRDLEVTSYLDIDLEKQIDAIEKALCL